MFVNCQNVYSTWISFYRFMGILKSSCYAVKSEKSENFINFSSNYCHLDSFSYSFIFLPSKHSLLMASSWKRHDGGWRIQRQKNWRSTAREKRKRDGQWKKARKKRKKLMAGRQNVRGLTEDGGSSELCCVETGMARNFRDGMGSNGKEKIFKTKA